MISSKKGQAIRSKNPTGLKKIHKTPIASSSICNKILIKIKRVTYVDLKIVYR